MATSKSTIPVVFGANSATETVANNTAAAISTVSSTLYLVEINNTLNTVNSFVKLYNVASGSVTVGTTDPYVILRVQASTKVTYHFDQGIAFGAAITLACVNSPGTAGTTSPTASVTVEFIYD